VSLQSKITPDRVVLMGALFAALAYCQDLRYDFILDDVPLILLNQTITSWRNWKSFFVTQIFADKSPDRPLAIVAIHYRPVYKLWQMLNDQLFGAVLPWWHLTSLLLHVLVTILVYQLGLKLMKERWTAALAALLFAFHPIHAESVSYVAASTDLLVAVFVLIAFLAYLRFRGEGGSAVNFIVSAVAAALAMLSKETAVMFPWLLVAYEALREIPFGARRTWKRYVWTLPFFGIVASYVAARTLLFGLNTGPGPAGSRLAALRDIPLVLIVYLRNLLWPNRLSFYYPVEWSTQWMFLKGVGVAFVLAASIFLWNRYRVRPGARLQLVWAAILFVPAVLGVYTFVPEDWIHDRHMYLVSVPICLIAAVLLTDPKFSPKVSLILSSLALAALLIETSIQVPRFSDQTTIYGSSLKVAPRNVLARKGYAFALWTYGRHEEGLREFRFNTELSPQSPEAYETYGMALAEIGRYDEAAVEYAKALHWMSPSPFRAFILSELAAIEIKRLESQQAEAHMFEALRIAPRTLGYHALLAQALSQQGRTAEAEEESKLETGIQLQYLQEHSPSRNSQTCLDCGTTPR
jgi:tetratricopeptide (TPR) repeat protein